MKSKLLTILILSGFCKLACPESPQAAPDIYAAGPTPPLLANSGLFGAERAAYALLEAVLHQTKAVISSTSCANSASVSDISIYTDGSVNDPAFNFVTVNSIAATYTLNATLNPYSSFWGQTLTIKQPATGAFLNHPIYSYSASVAYNGASSIMVMNHNNSIKGINGLPDTYQSQIIKDFYAATDSSTGLPYIFDWGVQSLSKLNYPVETYWQRSKALRDDAEIGRTVFELDRIIGASACQIIIDISGDNNEDYFWQSGTLTISTVPPSPAYQFNF
jgi:hypothetical protein